MCSIYFESIVSFTIFREHCILYYISSGSIILVLYAYKSSSITRHKRTEIADVGWLSQVFLEVACTEEDRRETTTHQELHPAAMLSLIASLTPFSDFNQSPRNMYVLFIV